MLIGYARISAEEQTLDRQLDALGTAGCGETEAASGATAGRPV